MGRSAIVYDKAGGFEIIDLLLVNGVEVHGPVPGYPGALAGRVDLVRAAAGIA